MLNKQKCVDSLRLCSKIPIVEHFLSAMVEIPFLRTLTQKLAPRYYQYRGIELRNCTRNGIRFLVDISSYHGWYVFFYPGGSFPKVLIQMISNGDTVFDIGSNIGEVLLNFAKKTGPSGMVFGFEPYPPTFNDLKTNVELNHFSNVDINNIALGDTIQEVNMELTWTRNPGTASITNNESNSKAIVNCTTLDDFCEKNKIEEIDIIKCDTEGYELKILQGAARTIQKFRPILFVEVVDRYQRSHGSSAYGLLKFIEANDYQIYDMNGSLIDISQIDVARNFDVVCRPKKES